MGDTYEYVTLSDIDKADLQLHPSLGNVWIDMDGLDLGKATTRDDQTSFVDQSGVDDRTVFSDDKTVTLQLIIASGNGADLAYLRRLLDLWTQPRARPVLRYKTVGQPENSIILRAKSYTRPISANADATAMVADVVQIIYQAPFGVDECSTVSTVVVPCTGVPTTVTTLGNAPARVRVRMRGPSVNPSIVNQTLDNDPRTAGARLSLKGTVTAGNYIEWDSRFRTVALNGLTDDASTRDDMIGDAQWFTLQPGGNVIIATDDAATGTMQLLWQDSYG